MSGDHTNSSIVDIGQNAKKSPGDLRRLGGTILPVENHHRTLVWKNSQWTYNNNNNNNNNNNKSTIASWDLKNPLRHHSGRFILLFFIATMPLNNVLRKCTGGYKFEKSQEKIDHFMYVDDMKVFKKWKGEDPGTHNENILSGSENWIWHWKMKKKGSTLRGMNRTNIEIH